MSKRTGISALIMVSLLALVTFGLTSCMPGADLRAKRDQDARRTAQMNKLLGRGVNLGNALEAPREGEWGVTLKEEYFDIIKQAGFNSIRLPVRWSAHAMAEKPYTIDHNFFKRIDWAVNCAISRNMPIMVNVQQYVELYTDPNAHRERFIALWKQIAEHYKDYPDKLLLELFNEPDDALTPELWNDFLKDTLAVVRESNPNRIVVIDPARDSIPSSLKFLKIPENDRNIIVSVHYYFPLAFTHQGAPWMAKKYDPNSWMGTKWMGTDAEKKAITDEFDIAVAWSKANNRPVNLGEFGTYKKADIESRVRWTKFVADTAAQRGMSLLYWEFCAQEFGLYDRDAKTWRKPLLDAVIPPAVSSTNPPKQ